MEKMDTMEKAFHKTAAWTEFAKTKLICITAHEHMRAAATNPAIPMNHYACIAMEAQDALQRLHRARAGLELGQELVEESVA